MKPFKTFKGWVLPVSALLLVTSCSRTVDELSDQSSRDVNRYDEQSASCDVVINLESFRNRPGFFFVGDKTNAANLQEFSMGDFSDNLHFDVMSNVGTPYHDMASGSIGVASPGQTGRAQRSIGAGEELWLTLSSTYAGQLMSGFDVVLNGNSATAGTIELYKGAELVETLVVSTSSATAQNFGLSFQTPFGPLPAEFKFFDQIRFKCSAGDYRIYGPQPNGPNSGLLPTTKFYLADVAQAIYMRNRGATGGPNAVRFINQGKFPSELNVASRQTKSALADNTLGSGEYNNMNADKWLKISSTGGSLVFNDSRIGVGSTSQASLLWGSLQSGEEIVIEPGNDFPASHFASLEFREAITPAFSGNPDSKLDWKAYDGAVMVASGSSSGVDANFNFVNPGVKFNKLVLTGRTSTSRGGLGRYSSEVISAYPACNDEIPE
jgi:hypothetical protein